MKRCVAFALLAAAALPAGCMTRNKMWTEPSYMGDKRIYAGNVDRVAMAARDAGVQVGFTLRREEAMGVNARQFLYSQGLSADTSGRYLRIRVQAEGSGIAVWAYVRSKMESNQADVTDSILEREVHGVLAGLLGVQAGATPPPASAGQLPLQGKGAAPSVLKNNRTVTLGRGVYTGNLVIGGNANRVTGVGPGATILEGDLVVQGNGNTVSQLTVKGRVLFGGNNNRLQGVTREGQVEDGGRNNTY